MTLRYRLRHFGAATAVLSLIALSGVPASAATDGRGRYQRAQALVTYTVYVPGQTFGLKRSAFSLVPCGAGRDRFLNAGYGSQEDANHRWFAINESAEPCADGPDGIGPAATFTINGATATVDGLCSGGRATCTSATRSSVLRTGFATVTLPASGAGRTSTFLQVYTEGFTVRQIRQLISTMRTLP
jgi:hypothetical protein